MGSHSDCVTVFQLRQFGDVGCNAPKAMSAAYRFAQSISRSRRTAGATGFLIFNQCSERPARTGDPSAIAQQQKARSFRLQAAFSLAKLYQSTGRTADARAVLAPALEGFSPMPEFPELAEAQMLLVILA